MTPNIAKKASPAEQAEWFLGIARSIVEGNAPDLMDEEAELLERLASCAEQFALKAAGKDAAQGVIESLSAVSVLRSSGMVPGRTTSDFCIGEAVRDIRNRRTGTMVGASPKTNELAVKWVGQQNVDYVHVENVVALPHMSGSKMKSTEVLFDETGTARLNGMVLSASSQAYTPILREKYGEVIESTDSYFVKVENEIHPLSISLKASKARVPRMVRETVSHTDNRREMLVGLHWLENDRRVESTTEEKVETITEATIDPSQIIFEAVMNCQGSAKDAMWMADHLSRQKDLLEAVEAAVMAREEMPREIVLESLSAAEDAFVKAHRHMPSITGVLEQMSIMSVPQAPNRLIGIADIGSRRAALGNQVPAVDPSKQVRMGMPNRVYVKRTSEIIQGAGKAKANTNIVSQVEDLARQAQVAASRGKNNPKQASANRAIAQSMIDLFQILFANEAEPWNPIRTATSPVRPVKDEGIIYEVCQDLLEEILNDKDIMEENDLGQTLVAGRPIRIRVQRPSTVYAQMRKVEPDGMKLQALQGLLTSVRRAARMVMGQPGSRQYHKRLAMAILSLLDFATRSGDQPWGVLDMQ